MKSFGKLRRSYCRSAPGNGDGFDLVGGQLHLDRRAGHAVQPDCFSLRHNVAFRSQIRILQRQGIIDRLLFAAGIKDNQQSGGFRAGAGVQDGVRLIAVGLSDMDKVPQKGFPVLPVKGQPFIVNGLGIRPDIGNFSVCAAVKAVAEAGSSRVLIGGVFSSLALMQWP